jgi:hypothetical protein
LNGIEGGGRRSGAREGVFCLGSVEPIEKSGFAEGFSFDTFPDSFAGLPAGFAGLPAAFAGLPAGLGEPPARARGPRPPHDVRRDSASASAQNAAFPAQAILVSNLFLVPILPYNLPDPRSGDRRRGEPPRRLALALILLPAPALADEPAPADQKLILHPERQ